MKEQAENNKEKHTKTGGTVSSRDASSPSENVRDKKEKFENKLIDRLECIEMGALFSRVENFIKDVKKLDEKIIINANKYTSKMTGYFQKSIKSFKTKKTR